MTIISVFYTRVNRFKIDLNPNKYWTFRYIDVIVRLPDGSWKEMRLLALISAEIIPSCAGSSVSSCTVVLSNSAERLSVLKQTQAY